MQDGSTKVGISIMLAMPKRPAKPEEKKPMVEDQVRAAIQRIDDGTGTEVDFLMLKRLKATLLKKKPTPRIKSILEMIEPTLRRFGYYF